MDGCWIQHATQHKRVIAQVEWLKRKTETDWRRERGRERRIEDLGRVDMGEDIGYAKEEVNRTR
jgi:hypothetical protein